MYIYIKMKRAESIIPEHKTGSEIVILKMKLCDESLRWYTNQNFVIFCWFFRACTKLKFSIWFAIH